MKTYSVCILNDMGIWITNFGEHQAIDDIDWERVKATVIECGGLAYGYMYGHNSRKLVSNKKRNVLWKTENIKEKLELLRDNYAKISGNILTKEIEKTLACLDLRPENTL